MSAHALVIYKFHRLCLPLPTFLRTSCVSIFSSPLLHASSRFLDIARRHGVTVRYLRDGAASLCATLRGAAASLCTSLRGRAANLCAKLCGAAASLCATLRGAAGSLSSALSPSVSHDGGTVPLWGAALCKCMVPLSSHDEGAVPSLHDEDAVPSSGLCGSARVLTLHACAAIVVFVIGVAEGAVAGVARSAAAGWRGSSCGVELSLAPLAES